jgi:hypothetical protein
MRIDEMLFPSREDTLGPSTIAAVADDGVPVGVENRHPTRRSWDLTPVSVCDAYHTNRRLVIGRGGKAQGNIETKNRSQSDGRADSDPAAGGCEEGSCNQTAELRQAQRVANEGFSGEHAACGP